MRVDTFLFIKTAIVLQFSINLVSGVFVSYLGRISACVPPKCGTTSWIEALQDISGIESAEVTHKRFITDWYDRNGLRTLSLNASLGFVRNHRRGWSHIIVIRDPLERLLSGYLERCRHKIRDSYVTLDDCAFAAGEKGEAPSFDEFIDQVSGLAPNNGDLASLEVNDHFRLQSSQCGPPQQYDFVVIWSQQSKDMNLTSQVEDTFNKIGLPGRIQKTYFPHRTSVPAGMHNFHSQLAGAKLKRYYTPAILHKVVPLLAPDYNMYNMTLPQWVHDIDPSATVHMQDEDWRE